MLYPFFAIGFGSRTRRYSRHSDERTVYRKCVQEKEKKGNWKAYCKGVMALEIEPLEQPAPAPLRNYVDHSEDEGELANSSQKAELGVTGSFRAKSD